MNTSFIQRFILFLICFQYTLIYHDNITINHVHVKSNVNQLKNVAMYLKREHTEISVPLENYHMHNGGMFGNVPTLCGGNDNYHHSFDSCISFQNSKWSQNHYMTVRRANTAGVQINSTTILESWLFGLHWIHHSRSNQWSFWSKTSLWNRWNVRH